MIYVDSSALAKLVIDESESLAFRRYASGRVMVSSALARIEVLRAVGRADPSRWQKATSLFAQVELVALRDSILEVAARLEPPTLRSLDAIHLASALVLGHEMEAFVAYDERLIDAASALGMPVASPA